MLISAKETRWKRKTCYNQTKYYLQGRACRATWPPPPPCQPEQRKVGANIYTAENTVVHPMVHTAILYSYILTMTPLPSNWKLHVQLRCTQATLLVSTKYSHLRYCRSYFYLDLHISREGNRHGIRCSGGTKVLQSVPGFQMMTLSRCAIVF